ncbi:MAG: N-acetyltransferase [Rhodobacteraceae bacterium]|nr:N-acetyltransferase [Paracoccaceae bacterium]
MPNSQDLSHYTPRPHPKGITLVGQDVILRPLSVADHCEDLFAANSSRAGTEAMVLMMQWAFEQGYRRYEWKCDALNQKSRYAAQRLGLSYEGVFRQMSIVKGRNRDTAWFAAIDSEWPALKAAFQRYLDPANFDAQGQPILALSALTHPLLFKRDDLAFS